MDPNIEKILRLPNKQKVALLILIVLFEGVAFYFGLYQSKYNELKDLTRKVEDMQNQVLENKKVADNLPRYKKEYEQLQKELEGALTELPNQKEIPSLLTSITNVGKGAGLEFLLFKPKPEEPKDFYAAVPVDISVSGPFQSVGNFFVAVSNLPRIVNISNVAVSDIKDVGGRTMMKVTCLATTFRFMDKKEIKDEKKK
jgi:type IV pilus assembly protein PilO